MKARQYATPLLTALLTSIAYAAGAEIAQQDNSRPDWVETLVLQEVSPLDRQLTLVVADFVIAAADDDPELSDPISAQRATECVMTAFSGLTTEEKREVAESGDLTSGVETVVERQPALEFELRDDIDSCMEYAATSRAAN